MTTATEEKPDAQPAITPMAVRGAALTPEQFKRNRLALIRFAKDQLVEATYRPDGKIIKTNDFYKIKDKYALTRRGAGALSEHYQFKQSNMVNTERTATKEYVSASYCCTVSDRSGRAVGVREGTCSTAEANFQTNATAVKYGAPWEWADGKYGKYKKAKGPADMRAAAHDNNMKAQKRGFVAAIIDAVNGHEILEVADEYQDIPEGEYEEISRKETPKEDAAREGVKAESNGGAPAKRVKIFLDLIGKDVFTEDERQHARTFVNGPKCTPEELENQIVRAEELMAHRTEGPFPE